jgi:hypothetical protein
MSPRQSISYMEAAGIFFESIGDSDEKGFSRMGRPNRPVRSRQLRICMFFSIFEFKIARISGLVLMLHQRRQDPFKPSASLRYTQFPVRKLEQIFHWIRLRIDLFTKLLGAVSATIRAWDKFILPDGDIGYFSDLDCAPDTATSREDYPMQLVRSIIESFEILEEIQGRLLVLKELLDGDLSTVRHEILVLNPNRIAC